MKPLANKTAVVTGGSRGIGAAIAKKLAAQGANVVITYSASKDRADAVVKELTDAGVQAEAILADANKPETMPALVDAVIKSFGGIDILVNNAGVWTQGPIGEITQEDYTRTRNVNVDSVFTLTNAAAKIMESGGRIINISSCLGIRATMPGISTYVASKFAVAGFTRGWAQDLGARGILVNAVLPGPIDTDMNPADSEHADQVKGSIPLGRYGHVDEIAGAVAFLAGPDATFISGATLSVDGGLGA